MVKKRTRERVVLDLIFYLCYHYENMPMQYTETFSAVKIGNFFGKILIFLIFMLKTLFVDTC